jgi:hypothetical protein
MLRLSVQVIPRGIANNAMALIVSLAGIWLLLVRVGQRRRRRCFPVSNGTVWWVLVPKSFLWAYNVPYVRWGDETSPGSIHHRLVRASVKVWCMWRVICTWVPVISQASRTVWLVWVGDMLSVMVRFEESAIAWMTRRVLVCSRIRPWSASHGRTDKGW